MIDWLVHDNASGVFLTTPSGSVDYSALRNAIEVERSSVVTAFSPLPDRESVLEIYRAVAMGMLVLAPGTGWTAMRLPGDVMTLLATSGTTGEPKLVPLTMGNWAAAVRSSARHLGHTAEDVWLSAMPLHHVGGLSVLFRSSHVGSRVRLLPGFDAGGFSSALAEGVTIASVVPTMLRRVLDADRRRYEGLKAVLVGGGPIPPGLLEEAWDRGIPALPTYGMTETCAQAATLRPGSTPDYRAHLLPGIEARIEPDGRIALRGEQVFAGYLGGPRLESGWFVTGDLGSLESDGSLRVLGRADDVIITGGENVDPAVVEEVVSGHHGVVQAMVVGLPSAQWGSEVVCLYTGTAPAKGLQEFARGRLRPFEVPKRWFRVDEIPATDLGKPDRRAGKEIVAELGSG